MNVRWVWQVPAEGSELLPRADRAILIAMQNNEGEWEGESRSTLLSRSALQRLVEQGHVLLDGKPLEGNAKLKAGAKIEITFPPPEKLELTPEDRPLDILYEDEYLLVLNKPPGLTVHPSSTQKDGTLVHALLHHVKDLSGIGGKLRPGIVHRLDKDTSGSLVITKTDAAHQKLAETFSKHEIDRVYWALCYGAPPVEKDRIESLLDRSPNDRMRMSMQVKTGRQAVTHFVRQEMYAFPKKNPFASFLEVSLETGRTHQIRVHLTGYGNSVLGDPVYGNPGDRQTKWVALPRTVQEAVLALPGQALHARVLGFVHPITGKKIRVEAEPPPGFAHLQTRLREFA